MALINIRFTHAGEYGLPASRPDVTESPFSQKICSNPKLLHCAYAACAALSFFLFFFWKIPQRFGLAPLSLLMCSFPHLPNYGFSFFWQVLPRFAKRFLLHPTPVAFATKIILKFMMTNFQRQLQRFAKPEKIKRNRKGKKRKTQHRR